MQREGQGVEYVAAKRVFGALERTTRGCGIDPSSIYVYYAGLPGHGRTKKLR